MRLLDGPCTGRSNTRPSVSGGQVAQLVEQRIENPRVGGSIPPLATIRSVARSTLPLSSAQLSFLSSGHAGLMLALSLNRLVGS